MRFPIAFVGIGSTDRGGNYCMKLVALIDTRLIMTFRHQIEVLRVRYDLFMSFKSSERLIVVL